MVDLGNGRGTHSGAGEWGHAQTSAGDVSGEGAQPGGPIERPKLSSLGASRFALQVTLTQATRDKLRRAQELLGHQVASGDLAQVLDRALDSLIEKLERRKFTKTDRPARMPKPGAATRRRVNGGRHIPARVRKAVCERDQGQCTFVSESGHRCEARKMLEFDHIQELARGGEATVANIRLRCRAHNQYTAEQTYGAGFVEGKRERSRARAKALRGEHRQDSGQSHAGPQP